MSGVVVIGACSGFGMELALALRGQGVTVVLADRLEPPPYVSGLDALALDAALVREVPQFALPPPIPAEFAQNLRISEISQVAPRWLPRPREQRTKRGG